MKHAMKRVSALIAAILLAAVLAGTAGAENSEYTLKARSLDLNTVSGTLAFQAEDSDYYQIIDADGQVLMGEENKYTSMRPVSSHPFFTVEVKSTDGIHDEGLVDAVGKVLVPAEYADVRVISDRWQAGVKLTPSNADDKDYTFTDWNSGEKSFFRVDYADFYFDGQKVGSLNRFDYGDGYPTAYNAYLCVTNLAREKVFYNSKLEKSPYTASYSGEFDTAREKGVTIIYHQGSGQQAFTASCTLDPADLQNPYYYDQGVVRDIQGNELFKTSQDYFNMQEFRNGYAIVWVDGNYGVIDMTGREVIQPQYKRVGNYEDNLFAYGYVSAVNSDGKFGFLDTNGNEVCPFVYSDEIVRNHGSLATIQNLDGSTIVLTAGAGELPEHYEDVSFPNYSNGRVFVGRNADRLYCLVDMYGNVLLPYTEGVRSITATADGTVALVSYGSREYSIFRFDQQSSAENGAAEPGTAGESGNAAADDGSWTCENGHAGNTGKFCSECGAPKPVEEAPLTACPNCGYEFGENIPKFCPECGTKIAAE